MGKTEKPKSSWQERRKDIKHKWLSPFIYLEWRCERLSYRLGRWAFLDILGHLGRLTILLAVISYFMGAEGRRKVKHYQAWQVINAAQGKPGSGGRIDALQDLNKDKVPLDGVDLSNAYLRGIDLKNIILDDANLSGAKLQGANLSEANLNVANLSGANLRNANFYKTDFYMANFTGAHLNGAQLSHTDLSGADFTGANLNDANLFKAFLSSTNLSQAYLNEANLSRASLYAANFSGANLQGANLSGATLQDANFSGANLRDANIDKVEEWQKILNINLANIYDVKNPPEGFIEWAKEQGAKIIKNRYKWEAMLEEERGKKK